MAERDERGPGARKGPQSPAEPAVSGKRPRERPRERSRERPQDPDNPLDDDGERRRRRAQFLRELNEARELRDRVQPRRARAARMRQQMRMRTFRW
ncbi:hypothetical protein ACH4PU_08790 [Streptomyces sp. NPDC021100]|uniref:hypothetical protein n=1 Tax=Streptomyces sp. NPDC021100 TaxID=3365114 RepID=UPI003799F093